MVRLPLSLLVLTYNESANIARCLDSVPFADEKIVIDCGSTDDTLAIARAHGARTLQQSWLGFGQQRRFATTQARHPWILFLDADEWLSSELASEIERRFGELLDSNYAGAFVTRSAWFMGARMRWYRPLARERIERLYHRERASWSAAPVHEALRFHGPALRLRSPLLHAYSASLLQRMLKDVVYAELRAREWQARGRRSRLWLCPWIFMATFFKDYVLRLGALDGGRGYVAAHLAASYAVYKRLRLHEMIVSPESVQRAREALVRHDLSR
jgi:glycosyltransferase involved in cell wall biosynthesis